MPESRPPVRVKLFAEVFTRETEIEETMDIPRDDWEAMSQQQRRRFLDEALEEHVNGLVGSGWELLGDDGDKGMV
jgi:hypothetical protein